MNAKNLELLALRAHAYVRINREDLAQKTTDQMSEIDADNVLTALSLAYVSHHSVGSTDKPIDLLKEAGEKSEFTPRLYELKAIAHARANDG